MKIFLQEKILVLSFTKEIKTLGRRVDCITAKTSSQYLLILETFTEYLLRATVLLTEDVIVKTVFFQYGAHGLV